MDIELKCQPRTLTGKGPARRLRKADSVPAVLYGPKSAPVPLALSAKRLERLLSDMGEESKLLRLTIEGDGGSETRHVMIREVQKHPFRKRLLHVDFYEVALDQAIEVEVPVELVGEAVGLKKGGIVNLVRRTLAVRCLPTAIPETIKVDVSGLDLGHSVHVADVMKTVAVEIAEEPGQTVVAVNVPGEEKAAAAAPEEPAEEGEGA